MRRITGLILLLISVIIISACSSKKAPEQLTAQSAHAELPSGFNVQGAAIELTTDQALYEAPVNKITLISRNTGTVPVSFGLAHYIEKLQNGEWYEIPYENMAFADIGVGSNPGEVYKQEVPIEYIPYDLPEGRYRIVKDFYINSEKKTIAAEFSIQ